MATQSQKGVPTGVAFTKLDHRCEECNAAVWRCDNGVYLDQESVDDGEWFLIPLGMTILAAARGVPDDIARYNLHEHQPPEGVD